MKRLELSKRIKVALMSLTVFAVGLFGLVGGVSWASVALAQGTVPPEPSGPSAFILASTETPEPGKCGEGLVTDTTPSFVGDPLTRELQIQPGTSQLLNATGAASFTIDLVAPENMPGSPEGYDLLSCGILTSGQATTGGPVALFRRGPYTCFPIPDGYVPTIFYYDPSPGIERWVHLVTLIEQPDNIACTSFRLPALLALFGVPI